MFERDISMSATRSLEFNSSRSVGLSFNCYKHIYVKAFIETTLKESGIILSRYLLAGADLYINIQVYLSLLFDNPMRGGGIFFF